MILLNYCVHKHFYLHLTELRRLRIWPRAGGSTLTAAFYEQRNCCRHTLHQLLLVLHMREDVVVLSTQLRNEPRCAWRRSGTTFAGTSSSNRRIVVRLRGMKACFRGMSRHSAERQSDRISGASRFHIIVQWSSLVAHNAFLLHCGMDRRGYGGLTRATLVRFLCRGGVAVTSDGLLQARVVKPSGPPDPPPDDVF